jgi:hypothetical protein
MWFRVSDGICYMFLYLFFVAVFQASGFYSFFYGCCPLAIGFFQLAVCSLQLAVGRWVLAVGFLNRES